MSLPKYHTIGASSVKVGWLDPADDKRGDINSMLDPDRNFVARLLRPYLDLAPTTSGPLHAQALTHAVDVLANPDCPPRWSQRVLPPSFRRMIGAVVGLVHYDVADPRDLPAQLRSPGWTQLVGALESWPDLKVALQARAAKLCSKLGFNDLVLDLVAKPSADRIAADENIALLAYVRACARYIGMVGHDPRRGPADGYAPADLIEIAHFAPVGRTRYAAAMKLVVTLGKMRAEPAAIESFGKLACKTLKLIADDLEPFDRILLQSGYHRGIAFLPLVQRDHQRVAWEMDRAEEFARAVPRDTAEHRVLADENLHPVLESQAKSAILAGELDRARELLVANTELDPTDPKPYIELGEIELEHGTLEKAISHFRMAAKLGPPGSAVAFYLAGHCLERQGRDDEAELCHLQSVVHDPGAVSALKRLTDLGRRLAHPHIADWADDRLNRFSDELAQGDISKRTRVVTEGRPA